MTDYTQAQRDQGVKEGWALPPDGKYPIKTATDLSSAIGLVGNSSGATSDVKAWIIKRAKALGLTDKLPDSWSQQSNASSKQRHRHTRSDLRTPEVRYVTTPVEIRSSTDVNSNDIVLTGTPIVYDTPYDVYDLDGKFSERMAAGCASAVLANQTDTIFCVNHRTEDLPLARTSSGTLTLNDSPTGLNFEARLDGANPNAQALASAIRRGDISQMSVGFMVSSDSWDPGKTQRQIKSLGALIDVSAVTFPASPTTHIEVAQRMLAIQPVETMARFDRIEAELRSGKVLSGPNASMIADAVQTLHSVLASSGSDFDHTAPDAPDFTADEDESGGPGSTGDGMDDGAVSDFDPSEVRRWQLELELAEMEIRCAL